jgi:hypothetical protein
MPADPFDRHLLSSINPLRRSAPFKLFLERKKLTLPGMRNFIKKRITWASAKNHAVLTNRTNYFGALTQDQIEKLGGLRERFSIYNNFSYSFSSMFERISLNDNSAITLCMAGLTLCIACLMADMTSLTANM